MATDVRETGRNPKRIQREVRKQIQNTGIGTKSQQALKLQQEQLKTERKTMSRAQREAVRAQLERMKELCKERNNLYERQNELKGQKWKNEKPLERQEMYGVAVATPYIFVENW